MHSKAKIFGHPIHPMLVAFPITFYATSLIGYAVYGASGLPFWFQVGWLANVAGVVTAAVAALPGFIDWAVGIPAGSKAKSVGLTHMLLNVAALAVFAINSMLQYPQWKTAAPDSTLATALSLIGVGFTLAAGFFGWELVQTHHVGVDLNREQEKAEPYLTAPRVDRERTAAS